VFIPSIRTEPEHANHQKCTTMPTSVANSAKQEKHFTSRDKQSSLQERVETNTHIAMIPGSVSAAAVDACAGVTQRILLPRCSLRTGPASHNCSACVHNSPLFLCLQFCVAHRDVLALKLRS